MLRAKEAGEDDQSFGLRFGKLGRLELDLSWDQIPHVFSNTGRTLYILYAALDRIFFFDPLETVCGSSMMGTSWNV